jgi:hypothetical protein
MFKPTLDQQYYIEDNKERVLALAKELWGSYNKFENDPMTAEWEHFDDPIKDKFIEAASYLIVNCDGV